MLEKIDDFIVDRVYQPIADMLSDHGSNSNQAGMSLAVGAMVLTVARYFMYPSQWHFFIILLIAPACLLMYFMHKRNEQKEGTMPAQRLQFVQVRVALVVVMLAGVFHNLGSDEGVLLLLLKHTSSAMLLSCMYFLACVNNPPRRRFTNLARDSV